MARPHKHPKTVVYWFRRAAPKDLRPVIGKVEVVRSLRTKDPAKAREAHASIAAEVEAHWKALRSPAQALSSREATALAGAFCSALTDQMADEPGSEIELLI